MHSYGSTLLVFIGVGVGDAEVGVGEVGEAGVGGLGG